MHDKLYLLTLLVRSVLYSEIYWVFELAMLVSVAYLNKHQSDISLGQTSCSVDNR